MKAMEEKILDVRPILANGGDPFSAIMQAKASLLSGQDLCLIAPFEPLPLYPIFEADDYSVKAERIADGEWHIFMKSPDSSAVGSAERSSAAIANEVDLRSLDAPSLLEKGLQAIGELGRDEILALHTQVRPDQVFEQIDAEAFDYDCEQTVVDHWTTHIWRVGY